MSSLAAQNKIHCVSIYIIKKIDIFIHIVIMEKELMYVDMLQKHL